MTHVTHLRTAEVHGLTLTIECKGIERRDPDINSYTLDYDEITIVDVNGVDGVNVNGILLRPPVEEELIYPISLQEYVENNIYELELIKE